MKSNYFERSYEILSYECDLKGRLHPLTVFNYMQELASNQADQLGFSVQKLMKHKMTWVLSRIHLKLDDILFWQDTFIGRTWPSGIQGKFALRDFQFSNSSGKIVGNATSSWMIIDIEKRKPVKLENIIDINSYIAGDRSLPDEFQPLPDLNSFENEKKFQVRYSDLDINRHVNHVAYIDWALEAVPPNILLKKYPIEIEVGYRREVFYGDVVISRSTQLDDKTFIHQILSDKDQQEIARLRTWWE
jgi:acyl-ACP thioesterase